LLFFDNVNDQIKQELKMQYILGAGLEYRIPQTPLYARGSYTIKTSPYKNSDLATDNHIIGIGVGLVLSNNFILDATFNYSSCDYLRANYGSLDYPALFSSYKLNYSATSYLLGFKYRF
jgi:predicted porin